MEGTLWENGPCAMASAGEGKVENPLRRKQQEAFPACAEEQERNLFIVK
jgi:hypothetical protein